MSPAWRWTFWVLLLAGAAGLVAFDQAQEPAGSIVEAVPQRAAGQTAPVAEAATRRAAAEAPMILAIKPRNAASEIDDAFPVRDWRPPPPPPAKPVPPAPPTAPAIPYNVFGKQFEDGAWQVFLRRGEQILVVKTRDTIDNVYRVEEIRPPVMTLIYLPLQQRQSMQIGSAE